MNNGRQNSERTLDATSKMPPDQPRDIAFVEREAFWAKEASRNTLRRMRRTARTTIHPRRVTHQGRKLFVVAGAAAIAGAVVTRVLMRRKYPAKPTIFGRIRSSLAGHAFMFARG